MNHRYRPPTRIEVTPAEVARCEDFARRVATDDKVERYRERNGSAPVATQKMDHHVGKIAEVAIEKLFRLHEDQGHGTLIKPPDFEVHHGYHDQDLVWRTAGGQKICVGVKATPWEIRWGWVFERNGFADSGVYMFCATTPTEQRAVWLYYQLDALLAPKYQVEMRREELRETKVAVYPWLHWERSREDPHGLGRPTR